MAIAALLPTKTIKSAQLTTIGAAISANNGNNFRLRLFLGVKDFNFLLHPIGRHVNARSSFYGRADQGLIVELSPSGSAAITQQSKSTVAFNGSSREINATENKVANHPIDAVLVEYDDGSRYVLTGPLPDEFLTTQCQLRRRSDGVKPLAAASLAFAKAGKPLEIEEQKDVTPTDTNPPNLTAEQPWAQDTATTSSASVEEDPARATAEDLGQVFVPAVIAGPREETLREREQRLHDRVYDAGPLIGEKTPSVAPPAPEPVVAPTHDAALSGTAPLFNVAIPKTIESFRDTLEMMNEEARALREQGVNLQLRIDDTGRIRAVVEVSYRTEL